MICWTDDTITKVTTNKLLIAIITSCYNYQFLVGHCEMNAKNHVYYKMMKNDVF